MAGQVWKGDFPDVLLWLKVFDRARYTPLVPEIGPEPLFDLPGDSVDDQKPKGE